MDEHITPSRIANSIMQDISPSEYYLLVEGVKDLNVYPPFINKDAVDVKPTFGKYKMRDVWEILEQRDFKNKLAIRDADFIRVRDNFDENYFQNFFITDTHDSEGMIFNTPTFEKVLSSILTVTQYDKVIENFPNLKDNIKKLAYMLGCLKLANKLDSLGLVFKPSSEKGKRFDYSNYINVKDFSYKSDDELITTSINFSMNRVKEKNQIKDFDTIKSSYEKVINVNHPIDEIVHGHDLSEILYLLLRKHFKFNIKVIKDSDSIEMMWAMSYDSMHFKKTNLYKEMNSFNEKNKLGLFIV